MVKYGVLYVGFVDGNWLVIISKLICILEERIL